MEKHKILVVTTSYSHLLTGAEAAGSFVNCFVNDLNTQQDIEVKVVYPAKTLESTAIFEKGFKVDFLPLSNLKIKNISHWKHILNTLKKGQKAVNDVVNEFKPDHILAMWALPSGYWAMRAAKKHGINYSVWCLGSDIWSLGKIPLIRSFLIKVLKNAYVRFADGMQLCNEVKQLSGKECLLLHSSRKLNNDVPVPIKKKESKRLCFIGRWHENKGIDILLGSLLLLKKDTWEKIDYVLIAGGGPLKSIVDVAVEDLIARGFPIRIKGYVDVNEATKIIDECDFVMIPSRIESIPVIFSDAIQMLRPVISMPVGDLPYLINKYSCGVLSESVTAIDYATAITTALNMDIDVINVNVGRVRKKFFLEDKNDLKFVNSIFNN